MIEQTNGGKSSRLRFFSILGAFLIISVALLGNYSAVTTTIRWLVSSHAYKSKTLAQPDSTNGELEHIEWDGWGWAGMDTTVYLVFDPTDSLLAAARNHQPGKFSGIPCEVVLVRRLESHWYTTEFYTNEFWGRCN